MDRYTLYCTPEQTIKALELGAPVRYASAKEIRLERYVYVGGDYFTFPTAEQMIGWLEEQGMQFNVHSNMYNEWAVVVYTENDDNAISEITDSDWKKTKKEATIAAIDAALEYLENLKQ